MKKALNVLCAIFVAVVAVLLQSCSPPPEDRFEYAASPFTASVEGELDGISFSATVLCNPTVSESDGVILSAHIYSPASLEGITLSRTRDGQTSARLGSASCDVGGFAELGNVLACLLPEEPHLRVEHDGDVTKYFFSGYRGEVLYRFQCNSLTPSAVSGEGFIMYISGEITK